MTKFSLKNDTTLIFGHDFSSNNYKIKNLLIFNFMHERCMTKSLMMMIFYKKLIFNISRLLALIKHFFLSLIQSNKNVCLCVTVKD